MQKAAPGAWRESGRRSLLIAFVLLKTRTFCSVLHAAVRELNVALISTSAGV